MTDNTHNYFVARERLTQSIVETWKRLHSLKDIDKETLTDADRELFRVVSDHPDLKAELDRVQQYRQTFRRQG